MTEQAHHAGAAARKDVFVSFAEDDRPWVEGFLLEGLQAAGVRVGVESQFAPGRPTSEQFEAAVENSDRVALVISPAYLADHSAVRVQLLAQQYGLERSTWPVLPIILRPVDRLPLSLSMLAAVDATDESRWEACLQRLLTDLNRPLPQGQVSPACPYPGMSAFTSEWNNAFHGRDVEIAEVLHRLRMHPVLAVIGPSGSGKSSLLHAGVIPRLPSGEFRVVTLRPGAHPHDALVAALGQVPPAADRTTILVIDQLEEVFTLARSATDHQAESFWSELAALCSSEKIRCLLALRADFYPEVMASPLWPTIRDHRLEVLPLAGKELEKAITAPAEAVGVHIESALVHAIVRDASGQPGSLPLVQETLVLLWGRLRRRYLPISAYDALIVPSSSYGEEPVRGLQVALARRADSAMAALGAEKERLVARRIFLRLVQLMEGRDDVRRQQRRRDLESSDSDPGTFSRVLRHLVDARLVISTTDEQTRNRREARIDLAHEAIISGWPALRGWIAERRDAERLRRRLEASAEAWVGLGRGAGGLLDPVELAQARTWLRSPDGAELGASTDLRDLVEASRASIDGARAREERTNRLFRSLSAALAVLLVVVVTVAVFAIAQRNEAERARQLARAGELAAAAAALPPEHVDRSMLLAQEALRLQETPVTIGGALSAFGSNPAVRRLLHAPVPQLTVRVTPDRRWAVSGGTDGALRLWDLAEDAPDRRGTSLGVLNGEVRSVALSPDGGTVAVTGSRGDVEQWTVPAGQRIAQPARESVHIGSVRAAAYSPDGRWLVTGGQDGRAVVRDATTGEVQRVLQDYGDWLNAVAFTPDGATMITAGGRTEGRSLERRIRLHDGRSGGVVATLPGHDDAVRALAVSPDGALLASAGAEGIVKVWSLATRTLVHELRGHTGRVFDVAFSADGSLLASAGSDHTVRIWDPGTGQVRGEPLQGEQRSVRSVAFVGNQRLLSVGSTRMFDWDATGRHTSRLARYLQDQQAYARAIAVDRTGQLVATGDDAGRVVLRNASDGSPTGVVLDAQDPVSGISFGPAPMVVTTTFTGRLRAWDATSGDALTADVSTAEQSLVVEVSPDGRLVATGGSGTEVRLWDASLAPVRRLVGHRSWIRDLAFRGSDGALVSVGTDGSALLWSLPDTEPVTLTTPSSPMESVAFSPDGATVATGNTDGQVVLWDVDTPNASSRGRPVLGGHEGKVTGIAYDPTGEWIVTTDDGGTVRMWDAATRLEPRGSLGTVRSLSDIAVSSSEPGVITVGDGGPAWWALDRDTWHRLSCAVAGRNLTAEEAQRYGFDVPPRTCAGLPGA